MLDSGKAAPKHLQVVRDIGTLRARVALWRRQGDRIGLVPTMGSLHEGHLALARQAQKDCARVVTTIFVNPIQFDRSDDLEAYPRQEAEDSAKLQDMGVDLLYAPDVSEMYPDGFATKVVVGGLGDCLCGATRPGHMDGVSTVVTKLLLQSLPDVSYFGEKDYQQLLIVKRMAQDLDMPLEVTGVPTVRESDGLALSSRNANLTPKERAVAPALYAVLQKMVDRFLSGTAVDDVTAWGRQELLAAGFEGIDYLDLREEGSLALAESLDQAARLFAAVWLGDTRLIDNVKVV